MDRHKFPILLVEDNPVDVDLTLRAFKSRKLANSVLVARDGEKCAWCGERPPAVRLEIHHIDGDHKHNRLGNLQLLCGACNRTDGNRERRGTPSTSPSALSERISRARKDRTREVRTQVDFGSGSAEMAANELYEIPYREWLVEEVRSGRILKKKDAIYEGAEVVGCSPKTTREYLDKIASGAGPVREERHDELGKIIVLRDQEEGR